MFNEKELQGFGVALNQRKADWIELWKQLAKCRAASIIEQTWRYYLQPLIRIPLGGSIIEGLTIAHGEAAELLELAIKEQTAIGWEKLLLGLGSTRWKSIQNLIDSANPKAPKRNADAWINTATLQLIKFSLQCWKARNLHIHGSTRQEQQAIALRNVREQIKAIYEQPPALTPHFRSIFEIPLEHRLRMSLQASEQWLSLIKHQVKATHHNFRCLIQRHKSMKTHLRHMRCEARSQAKERQLPETPRKAHRRAVQAAVKEMRAKLYRKCSRAPLRTSRRHSSGRSSKARRNKPLKPTVGSRQNVSEPRPPLRHHPP